MRKAMMVINGRLVSNSFEIIHKGFKANNNPIGFKIP